MKKIRLFFVILTLVMLTCNIVFANTDTTVPAGKQDAGKAVQSEDKGVGKHASMTVPSGGKDAGIIAGIAGPILGIIQAIAYSVAFIMVIVIAIRYMSRVAGVKADVKDTLLPYFIGALVVGAASSIVSMVIGWGF